MPPLESIELVDPNIRCGDVVFMSAFQHPLQLRFSFAQPSQCWMLRSVGCAQASLLLACVLPEHLGLRPLRPLYYAPPPLLPLRLVSFAYQSQPKFALWRDRLGRAGADNWRGVGFVVADMKFHPINCPPSNGPLLHPAALRDMMTHQHLVPFICDDERYGDGDGKAMQTIDRTALLLEDEEERVLLERRGDGGWGLPSCALDGASGGYMCASSPLTTSPKSLSCLSRWSLRNFI